MAGDALRLVSPKDLGEAEVRYLGIVVHVKQDVARFQITMYYFELGVFMEVLQSSSDSVYDLVPLGPTKLLALHNVFVCCFGLRK